MSGFDEVSKRLSDLSRRAHELDGQHSIEELMPPAFISRSSTFASVKELFEASPFKTESGEDFEAIPDDEWDDFISKHTSFASWQDMQESAATEWAEQRLRFD